MSDPFLTSFPKNIPQIRYISQKMKEDKDGRYCELVGWLIPGDATDSRGIRRSGYDIYVWKSEYAEWTRVGFTDGIPTVGAAYVLLMREDEIFWGKIGWLMHENEPIRVYYNARIASAILTQCNSCIILYVEVQNEQTKKSEN